PGGERTPGRRLISLLQRNFSQRHDAYYLSHVHALLADLLGGLLGSEDLVSYGLSLGGQTIQGAEIFVLNSDRNVPVLGIVFGGIEKNLVIQDQSFFFHFVID